MATSVANVMFTNAVYFPNFKIYSGATPGMLNYGCISHVFYAFASVAIDGSVFVSRVPNVYVLTLGQWPFSELRR